MRRYLLALSLMLGVFAGFAPGEAVKADHCNRIIVFTGVKGVGGFNTGFVGCTGPHANTHRITPGSNYASVRLTQANDQPHPASGVFTIGDKVVELDLKPNNEGAPTQFNSQEIPIGSSGNITVEIQYADGSAQKLVVPR